MLRTAQLLPPKGLSTLGFDPTRFPAEPPACDRASWQLPGPDLHRPATASLSLVSSARWASPPTAGRTKKSDVREMTMSYSESMSTLVYLRPRTQVVLWTTDWAAGCPVEIRSVNVGGL